MALGRTRLTASCRAVAEAPGTARRWYPQAQRQTRLGAWRPGSRSPRSWWLWQVRRRTDTGRRQLEGTGHRLGCLVYTQGRARTVMAQGWQVSPRWAAQWLAGRCSGESACGPSRVSGAEAERDRTAAEWEARAMEGEEVCAPPEAATPSTKQLRQHHSGRAWAPGPRTGSTIPPQATNAWSHCSRLLLGLEPPSHGSPARTHCATHKHGESQD